MAASSRSNGFPAPGGREDLVIDVSQVESRQDGARSFQNSLWLSRRGGAACQVSMEESQKREKKWLFEELGEDFCVLIFYLSLGLGSGIRATLGERTQWRVLLHKCQGKGERM